MFRQVLRAVATATATYTAKATGNGRKGWRLAAASTTFLNNYSSTACFTPPFTAPSTLQETKTKWNVWEDRGLTIPNVLLRDGARDLLLSASYRLRHGMVRHCTHVNPQFQDIFDELLKCNTEAELIQHVKRCLEELIPDDIQIDKIMRNHFIEAVNAIQTWQQMEDLISHPLLLSLRQRTSYINETVQILKNFTQKTFEDKQQGTYHTWKTSYNELMMDSPDQLTLPFDPEVIWDKKMRKLVKKAYNKKKRKARYIADGRAGLLCLFRDVNQHLNPEPHQEGPRASKEQTMATMHLAIGRVTLDAWDFNSNHKEVENITTDVLDLSRDYTSLKEVNNQFSFFWMT